MARQDTPSRKLWEGQVALENLVTFRTVIPSMTEWWQQILLKKKKNRPIPIECQTGALAKNRGQGLGLRGGQGEGLSEESEL